MPQLDIWVYWVVIGVIFMIIEMFTPGFVLGLIGFSAVISGLSAYLGFGRYVQIIVFIVSNLILFTFIRKIIYSYFSNGEKDVKTNIDALQGKKGKVVKKIAPDEHGEVKVGGEIWYAVADDDSVIEVDSWVIVREVSGSKLIVNRGE